MTAEDSWPGKQFGLPESGPRSAPSWSRRIGGFMIDWALAVGLTIDYQLARELFAEWGLSLELVIVLSEMNGFTALAVFVALHALGGLMLAGSPGHLVFRMRIAPIRGGRLGIVAPLIRPLLIALVIPPLMNDSDMRGAHDRLVGTVLVSR